MEAIETLLSQLSVEGIILVVVLFLVSVKFLGELFEYVYTKLKRYFNVKDEQQERHEEIIASLNTLKDDFQEQKEKGVERDARIDKISAQLDEQDRDTEGLRKVLDSQITKFTDMEAQVKTLCERMQDSTRAYIIDKHHHFCYQIHAIDDMSLQDLERRFMYYKAAGGDTFIDSLMEEVRALPRLTVEQMKNQIGGGC